MYLPNYRNGSIVNLMSSISLSLDGKPKYKPLRLLNPKELSDSQNIILMVIDGLGYEYLKNHGQGSFLYKNLKGKITSVFPSTTAAAITTFTTGLAPKQHAVTGWFTYLKEADIVSTILPFKTREGEKPLEQLGIKPEDIFNVPCFSNNLNAESYILIRKDISGSDYTLATSGDSGIYSYKHLKGFLRHNITLDDYFKQIRDIINSSDNKKFVYAYWSEFDRLSHDYGVESAKVKEHFEQINSSLEQFLKTIYGTNTSLIVTADHGMIDTTEERTIWLKNHPDLEECLSQPLCGEPRVAYCYVKPSKIKQFKNCVKRELRNVCFLYKSKDLARKNFFGLYKANKKLFDRIGDFTLIMKENYTIRDLVPGEKRNILIGNHGGVSKEEMFVPLFLIKK